jgi:hypothetical protein
VASCGLPWMTGRDGVRKLLMSVYGEGRELAAMVGFLGASWAWSGDDVQSHLSVVCISCI